MVIWGGLLVLSSKFKFPAVIFFFLMYSFQRVFLPNLLPAVKCFQTSSWLSFPFFRIVSHCVGQTSLELVISSVQVLKAQSMAAHCHLSLSIWFLLALLFIVTALFFQNSLLWFLHLTPIPSFFHLWYCFILMILLTLCCWAPEGALLRSDFPSE